MNTNKRYSIGVDVGGSHIACAMVDLQSGEVIGKSIKEVKINSNDSISRILAAWESVLNATRGSDSYESTVGMGVAMPGPFDYERGISQIAGVKKFDSLYGLNLRQSILSMACANNLNVVFENDATCFALGEHHAGAAHGSKRSLVVTLGTGFGSTFLADGAPQREAGDKTIPPEGYLFHVPFGSSIADDYFSTRWFTSRWKETTGKEADGVREIAELAQKNDEQALRVFNEFADNLAEFIFPWLKKFQPDVLVLGGSIAKASALFLGRLKEKLQEKGLSNPNVKPCELWDKAPIVGAAMSISANRGKTEQLPVYQILTTDGEKIENVAALAAWVVKHKTVVIDGRMGVLWDGLVERLSAEPALKGRKVRWFHADAAMKTPQETGCKLTDEKLKEWFYMDKLTQIKPDADADINILVGCGAALAGWNAKLAHVEV